MRLALVFLIPLLLFGSLATMASQAPLEPDQGVPAAWRGAEAPLESALIQCQESLAPCLPTRSRWAGHLFGRPRMTILGGSFAMALQPVHCLVAARTLQRDDVRLQI